MPDTPDFSRYLPGSNRFSLQDLGELAARLGSIDVYDRRGEVILLEDFAYGLSKWSAFGRGTLASVEVQASNTNLGAYCIRMVGGSDDGLNSNIQRALGSYSFGRMGGEISIAFPTEFDNFAFNLNYRYGSSALIGSVKIDRITNAIYIQDINNLWQKIGDLTGLVNTAYSYHTLKLCVDFNTGYYIRAMFDYNGYDLSPYHMYVQGVPFEIATWCGLTFYSRATFNDVCTIGHAIFTANEQ